MFVVFDIVRISIRSTPRSAETPEPAPTYFINGKQQNIPIVVFMIFCGLIANGHVISVLGLLLLFVSVPRIHIGLVMKSEEQKKVASNRQLLKLQ